MLKQINKEAMISSLWHRKSIKLKENTCILLSHIHMFNAIKTRVWGELKEIEAFNGADTNPVSSLPKGDLNQFKQMCLCLLK